MIGVVGHDAGGVEIITSYIHKQGLDCVFYTEGAATAVVGRKLGNVKTMALELLVSSCDWLLCGTSFLSDLEWRAIGMAQAQGKRCVVVLDHWVNYRQRFLRHGEWHWPDEVWVGDEVALSIAAETLPEVPVRMVPNAYFEDIRQEFAAMEQAQPRQGYGMRILYVCEPLREDGIALYGDERYWGYTEEEALRYFLAHVGSLASEIERIVVRPHPQEERGKYDWAMQEFDLPLVCGENKTLLEQIASSDIVAGCATMAMVVGLLADKRVISCIPPKGKTIPLPHPEIEDMNQLIAALGTGARN